MNLPFSYLRSTLLFCCLLFGMFAFGQTGWQPLGPDDANQPLPSNASDAAVAIHPLTGEAYMAFNNPNLGFNGEGFVRKFNSETGLWEDVGITFSAGSTNNLDLAFDSLGTLYVGYQDTANGSKATVKKLDTDTNLWETVGTEGFSAGLVSGLTMIIGSDNTVYIGYGDSSLSGKATVKKFDGAGWVTVGMPGFTQYSALYTSLAVAADGTLYMGFASWYSGLMKASVMMFDGSSWQLHGPAAFSDGGTSGVKVAVNPVDNVPYVAYHDYEANVRKFNGTDWEYVGAPDFSESLINRMCFAISPNGTPFIGFSDNSPYGLFDRATVMSFNGTAWETVGAAGFSVEAVFFTDIALADNTPYMSFVDELNGNKPTLMKFDDIEWECLGGTMGFSEEATYTTSWSVKSSDLIITDDGVPYMGYIEGSNERSLTVKKFNFDLNEWETVGSPGFSSQADYHVSMASHQNTPYIAYVEWAGFSNKATVMKYNGTAWETVGEAGFTLGSAYQHCIAIAPDGIPFLIYKDGANDDKATVMRFNGAIWEVVGSAGFSAGIVYDPVITITADGVPYVAFTESTGFESSSVVMMFNGIGWEIVGEQFGESANNINLQMGPDGYIYVAYTEGALFVKKFNGTEWEAIGEGDFPEGYIYNTKLAIKPDGQLFVSFQDNGIGDKVTVMRYNGIEWVPVGNPGLSAWSAYMPDIAITPDGQDIIVAYSSPCTYAKTYDITCFTPAPLAENQAFCNGATVLNLVAEGENLRWYDVEHFGTPFAEDILLTSGTYYVAQMQNDCEGPRTAVDVIVNTPDEPVVNAQTLCAGAIVSNLEAEEENLLWYTGEDEEEPLAAETLLVTGTYYVSQIQNDCESSRAAIDIVINSTTEPAATEQILCQGATVSNLEADGDNLKWYAEEEDEEALIAETLLATGTYYVSQTVNDCESSRVAVNVVINITDVPVSNEQSFCNAATVADLVADGENLKWYAAEEGEEVLSGETLLATGTYYVSQTLNDCESHKVPVDIVINTTDLPDGELYQVLEFNEGTIATIEDIEVTGSDLKWYDAEGNVLMADTELVNLATYYVTQTINGCESGELGITVEVVWLLETDGFEDTKFAYYPNPVADKLHIVFGSNITTVEVYTLRGEKVLSQVWNMTEGDLNMSAMAEGTYFIRINTENGTKTFKVVKAL